ncbi:MAG: raffinose/stachyose/melibiose transport system permease protein, partial [Microbacteriaceae bacterium]|nr:raffinose/stachyose/melibiose transport system permease protein [Microbacteriaceae bacterium]
MTQATTALASLSRRKSGKTGLRLRGGWRINLLYVPALLLFAVFTVYPLVSGIGFSFTDWDGYSPGRAFVALQNYLRLFQD